MAKMVEEPCETALRLVFQESSQKQQICNTPQGHCPNKVQLPHPSFERFEKGMLGRPKNTKSFEKTMCTQRGWVSHEISNSWSPTRRVNMTQALLCPDSLHKHGAQSIGRLQSSANISNVQYTHVMRICLIQVLGCEEGPITMFKKRCSSRLFMCLLAAIVLQI